MRKIFRILSFLVLLLTVLIACVIGFLQTSSGKAKLPALVAKLVPGLSIDTIEGQVPNDMRISSLTMSDSKGIWLSVEDIHLRWHPLELIQKIWDVETLSIDHIHLLRLPLSETKDTKADWSLPTFPHLRLGTLNMPDIQLDEAAVGQSQQLSILGHGVNAGYALTAQNRTGKNFRLDLKLNPGGASQASYEEAPGGLIASLLHLPENAPVRASLPFSISPDGMALPSCDLELGSAHITGAVEYKEIGQTVSGQFDLQVANLSEFSQLAATPLQGSLQGRFAVSGSISAINAKLQLQSDQLRLSGTTLSSLQVQLSTERDHYALETSADIDGQPSSLSLSGNYTGNAIHSSDFKLGYGPYYVTGEGQAELKERTFNVDLTLQPTKLEHILQQQATLTGYWKAKGGFDQFDSELRAQLTLPDGKHSLIIKGQTQLPDAFFSGDIQGDFTAAGKQFTLTVPVKADRQRVKLEPLLFTGEAIRLEGPVSWHIPTTQMDAALTLSAPDLRPLGSVLHIPLSGQLQASANLQSGERQQGAISITGKAIRWDSTRLDGLTLRASGNQQALSLTAQTSGSIGDKKLSLGLEAQGVRSDATTDIIVQQLNAVYAGARANLLSPAHLTLGPDYSQLRQARIAVADGTLSVQGKMTEDHINADMSLRHLDLDKLPLANPPSGSVDATLTLSGSKRRPKAELSSHGNVVAGRMPLAFSLVGHLRNDMLDAKATIHSRASHIMDANITMPAAISLEPIRFSVNAQTPLRGSLALDAPLELLNTVLYANGVRVNGTIAGSGTMSGSLGDPMLHGDFVLRSGMLDHQDSGICLRDASARLHLGGKQLTLSDFSASGAAGSLSGNAAIDLSRQGTVDGKLRLTHFPLFCGGVAKGIIDGSLSASGTMVATDVTGKFTLGPLNVQLPGSTPGQVNIPEVKTVIAKAPVTELSSAQALTLQVTLDAPGRIFVRGRGLDAEFLGQLNITGGSGKIQYIGTFQSRHGRFALLDHEMTLTDATLRFDGPIPPSPFLDINAETTVQGTSIQVRITGDTRNPEFTFTSTPSLPKDEILALLLFGRSLSSLTPFQAIQLAQSVAELSGKSSGPGVLDKLRNALGVDRLDVGTGTDNSVTVGAGKYISNKVYVGVTQGAKPEDRAVTTEVEITPKISGTSSIDAQGNQGVGLQWKYDY